MISGNIWFIFKLLGYLALCALIFGFLGWWLRGLFSSGASQHQQTHLSQNSSASSTANSRDREKIKKLESQLKTAESTLQSLKTAHEGLQKNSVSRQTLEQVQSEHDRLKNVESSTQKRIAELEGDLTRAQSTVATLNTKVNEAGKLQQSATLTLQSELAKTKEELARVVSSATPTVELKKEIEQLRESLAVANRANAQLRKNEAALAAAESRQTKSAESKADPSLQRLFAQASQSSASAPAKIPVEKPISFDETQAQLAAEKAVADKVAAERAAVEQAAKAAAAKLAAERAAQEQAEKAAADQAAKLAAEKLAAEQAAQAAAAAKLETERAAKEQAEKAAADQAATKSAAEQIDAAAAAHATRLAAARAVVEQAEQAAAERAAKIAAAKAAESQATAAPPAQSESAPAVSQGELLLSGSDEVSTASPAAGSKNNAASEVLGKRILQDDLQVVEGIGPKIKELLHAGGVTTWSQLAAASPERLREILHDAGEAFAMHDPSTWPQQAALARDGEWAKLKTWQDELDGGKV